MNLAGRFIERIAEWGDRPAIREPDGRSIGYAALRRQILGFARFLKARGFAAGDAAVIQAPTGAAFTTAQIAVTLLGGASVLVEPGFGDALYYDRLKAARSKWMLVHPLVLWANRIPGARSFLRRRDVLVPPLLPASADLRRIVIAPRFLASLANDADGAPPVADVPPRSDLAIIFTGGSTGAPKGVRISHESVMHAISTVGAASRDLGIRTFIADNPQQVLFGLTFGNEVLVARGRPARRAAMVRSLIESGTAGAYFGAPYLWKEMLEQSGHDRARLPASLKAVFLGGAPVTPGFLTDLRAWLHPDTRVTIIYGMTEAGAVARAPAADKLAWTGEGDFVGWVVPGTEISVTDEGEIVVQSPGLFTGYVGQPERPPGSGFHTGDLGRTIAGPNGETGLVLLGRSKDMIIRAGVNIYPTILEDGIRAIHDDQGRRLLREVALVGLWNRATEDEVVVLCWQPAAGAAVDEARLAAHVLAVTGVAAQPDHFLKVDPIPITGRLNKVDKNALRRIAAERFGLDVAPRGQRHQPPADASAGGRPS